MGVGTEVIKMLKEEVEELKSKVAELEENELTPQRRDFIKRLIKGVRNQCYQDPAITEAKEEYDEDIVPLKWVDAVILCRVIEEDVLKAG